MLELGTSLGLPDGILLRLGADDGLVLVLGTSLAFKEGK